MIEFPPSMDDLRDIVRTLREDPAILGMCGESFRITVRSSDTRKRYTDFHRLIAVGTANCKPEVFWLRRIKNKPAEEAGASLQKQFDILSRAFRFFRQLRSPGFHLSVCEPIALLKEQQCLITRECRGQLMNRYLVTRIPMLQQADLDVTFRNVGIWLKSFHTCFSEPGVSRHETRLDHAVDTGDCGGSETICHCDFSPRNVFVGRDSVEVIDFAGAQPGVAQVDVEFFVRYVDSARFNGLYSRRHRSRLINVFVDAYTKCVPQMIHSDITSAPRPVHSIGK